MCIDWQQLDTGTCHRNAGLQKAEWWSLRGPGRIWIRSCGFLPAVDNAARAFVPPGELSPRGTLVHKAAPRHVEGCLKRLDYITATSRAQTNVRATCWHALRPQSPSPPLFATGPKLLQKGAKVKIFPRETSVSISSQFTGVRPSC